MTDRSEPEQDLVAADPDTVRVAADPVAVATNATQIAQTLSGPLPPATARPIPRWVSAVAVTGLVLFIPWIVYLGFTLPSRAEADDYDVAWLGFDIAMWAMMVALAYCLIRGRQGTAIFGAVTATLLLVDAWFDVITASGRDDYLLAVGQAIVLEVPLAIVCLWAAINVERLRSQGFHRLRARLENAAALANRRHPRVRPPRS